MNSKPLIILFLSVFILASCSKSRIYEKHSDIANDDWIRIDKNHIIKFTVPLNDTLSTFDVKIAVRYMTGFPYTTLHVGLTVTAPDGEEKYSIHDLRLRGDDGSYNGEGMGDIWDINIPVLKQCRFNHSGVYKFEVENLMSKYDTPGIMQIGLIIDKIKQ